MKTVAKINPEQEYKNAKKLIREATHAKLNSDSVTALDLSVDNLITAARVLMEREDNRMSFCLYLPVGRFFIEND